MRRHLYRQSGFSLFELALGLMITGLVIGGLWMLGSNLFYTQNINQLEKGIVATAARIRNFYRDRQMQKDKSNINNQNFIQLDLISPEILVSGSIQHKLSPGGMGAITISYDNSNCGAANSFAMTLATLANDACNQLLPRLAGTREQIQSNGIIALLVNNMPVIVTSTNNNVASYDFAAQTAATACMANGNNAGTTVEICFAQ